MNIERLEKLATFLNDYVAKLPKDRFNMNTWADKDNKRKKLGECGTVACALSWATAIPEFSRAGLKLSIGNLGNNVYTEYSVVYKNKHTIYAAREFFNISDYVVTDIFLKSRTAKIAANKIRKYITKYKNKQLRLEKLRTNFNNLKIKLEDLELKILFGWEH